VKISGSADDEEKAAGCEYGFEDRQTIGHWAKHKMDKNELFLYQKKNNHDSLDGLTGLKSARRDSGELMLVGDIRAWMRKIWGQKDAMLVGFMIAHLIYVAILAAQQFSLI
jgi:hypothetical protein